MVNKIIDLTGIPNVVFDSYNYDNIIFKILRKGMPIYVNRIKVKDLDKTKCSSKFLSHNLPDDTFVFVKCMIDGKLDLRGKKEEYRIIVPDKLHIRID